MKVKNFLGCLVFFLNTNLRAKEINVLETKEENNKPDTQSNTQKVIGPFDLADMFLFFFSKNKTSFYIIEIPKKKKSVDIWSFLFVILKNIILFQIIKIFVFFLNIVNIGLIFSFLEKDNKVIIQEFFWAVFINAQHFFCLLIFHNIKKFFIFMMIKTIIIFLVFLQNFSKMDKKNKYFFCFLVLTFPVFFLSYLNSLEKILKKCIEKKINISFNMEELYYIKFLVLIKSVFICFFLFFMFIKKSGDQSPQNKENEFCQCVYYHNKYFINDFSCFFLNLLIFSFWASPLLSIFFV